MTDDTLENGAGPRRVSVVIPTLDEVRSIGATLEGLPRDLPGLDLECIVVDGGSSDGTVERARALGARVVLEARAGYGRAYRTGFAHATHDVVVALDGDMSYPSEIVPALVDLLEEEGLDFISCCRLARLEPGAMSLSHRIGNRLLTAAANRLHGLRLRDSQSGMWVVRRAALARLRLTSDGMAFSEEIKIEAWRRGLRCREVEIPFRPRWGRVKLETWKDGLANLRFLLRKRRDFA